MHRSSPADTPDWLNRASVFGGFLLALTAAFVLAGRESWIDALLNLPADTEPVRFDTALSVCLFGLALLALESREGRLAWLAAAPAGIGLATLARILAGRSLFQDELLTSLQAAVGTAAAGRMPGLAALALFSASICVLLLKSSRMTWWRVAAIVPGASLTISIGLASLLGQMMGLSEGSVLHPVLRPGLVAALWFVLGGILILIRLWRCDPDREVGVPGWLPAPVVAVGVTLTLLFAAALRDREAGFVRSTTRLAINNVAAVLNLELDDEAQALQRMAARWMRGGQVADALRDQDGAAYREDFPALRSLTWIDESGRTDLVLSPRRQRIPRSTSTTAPIPSAGSSSGRCRTQAGRRFPASSSCRSAARVSS